MLKRKASHSPCRNDGQVPAIKFEHGLLAQDLSCDANDVDIKVESALPAQDSICDADYLWRSPSGIGPDDRLAHVTILERAINDADNILRGFIDSLGKQQFSSMETNFPYIYHHTKQAMAALDQYATARPMTVGMIGSTGLGKTSFINAIIGHSGLLPESQVRACTAVFIELHHNTSEDPSERYIGRIEYLSLQEYAAELDIFFDDIQNGCDTASPQETMDAAAYNEEAARKDRCAEGIARLNAVVPQINMQNIQEWSTTRVLEIPAIAEVLGKVVVIKEAEAEPFAQQLDMHVNSVYTRGDKSVSTMWALVKSAKVEHKASLLKHGIVLCDIPGTMDANRARAAVGERHMAKLDRICVFGRADRAADNKDFMDALSPDSCRDLSTNNQMTCSVVTRIDEMDWERYLAQSARLQTTYRDCHDEYTVAADTHMRLQQAWENAKIQVRDLPRSIKSYESRERALQKHRRLRSGSAILSDDVVLQKSKEMNDKKTVKEAELEASLVLVTPEKALELQLLSSRLKALEQRLRAACIADRNTIIITTVKDSYARKSHDSISKGDLQVFPVSSTMFRSNQSRRSSAGFPTIESTGIPAYMDWLITATLPTRILYADEALRQVETSIHLLLTSMNNSSSIRRLPVKLLTAAAQEELKLLVQPSFSQLYCGLLAVCHRANLHLSETIVAGTQRILQNAQKPCLEKRGATVARFRRPHSVDDRPVPVAWNTYRAVAARKGRYETTRKSDQKVIKHNWIAMLAGDFKDEFRVAWHQIFHIDLDAYATSLRDTLLQQLKVFMTTTSDLLKRFPQLEMPFERLQVDLEQRFDLLHMAIRTAIDRIVKKSRSVLLIVNLMFESMLASEMTTLTSMCGKGVFDAMDNHFAEWLKDNHARILSAISKEIVKVLEEDFRVLEVDLIRAFNSAKDDSLDLWVGMVKNHSVGQATQSVKSTKSAREELYEVVTDHCQQIQEAWRSSQEISGDVETDDRKGQDGSDEESDIEMWSGDDEPEPEA